MWVQKLPGGGVDVVAYAPDGRTLYTRDRGRMIAAWDVATRTRRAQRFSYQGLGYASALYPLTDGRVVGLGTDISVWDGAFGETSFSRPSATWPYNALHVTPDGRAFYFGSTGREITGINLNTNALLPPVHLPDGKPPASGSPSRRTRK
jgi:hypothetical protein